MYNRICSFANKMYQSHQKATYDCKRNKHKVEPEYLLVQYHLRDKPGIKHITICKHSIIMIPYIISSADISFAFRRFPNDINIYLKHKKISICYIQLTSPVYNSRKNFLILLQTSTITAFLTSESLEIKFMRFLVDF